ncbi:unnamed protein product [Amoebophrya sp. A120]|nr:unnamed protein product [Amoebophrya sp. A120]|eukprot:GSA120T00013769001.1
MVRKFYVSKKQRELQAATRAEQAKQHQEQLQREVDLLNSPDCLIFPSWIRVSCLLYSAFFAFCAGAYFGRMLMLGAHHLGGDLSEKDVDKALAAPDTSSTGATSSTGGDHHQDTKSATGGAGADAAAAETTAAAKAAARDDKKQTAPGAADVENKGGADKSSTEGAAPAQSFLESNEHNVYPVVSYTATTSTRSTTYLRKTGGASSPALSGSSYRTDVVQSHSLATSNKMQSRRSFLQKKNRSDDIQSQLLLHDDHAGGAGPSTQQGQFLDVPHREDTPEDPGTSISSHLHTTTSRRTSFLGSQKIVRRARLAVMKTAERQGLHDRGRAGDDKQKNQNEAENKKVATADSNHVEKDTTTSGGAEKANEEGLVEEPDDFLIDADKGEGFLGAADPDADSNIYHEAPTAEGTSSYHRCVRQVLWLHLRDAWVAGALGFVGFASTVHLTKGRPAFALWALFVFFLLAAAYLLNEAVFPEFHKHYIHSADFAHGGDDGSLPPGYLLPSPKLQFTLACGITLHILVLVAFGLFYYTDEFLWKASTVYPRHWQNEVMPGSASHGLFATKKAKKMAMLQPSSALSEDLQEAKELHAEEREQQRGKIATFLRSMSASLFGRGAGGGRRTTENMNQSRPVVKNETVVLAPATGISLSTGGGSSLQDGTVEDYTAATGEHQPHSSATDDYLPISKSGMEGLFGPEGADANGTKAKKLLQEKKPQRSSRAQLLIPSDASSSVGAGGEEFIPPAVPEQLLPEQLPGTSKNELPVVNEEVDAVEDQQYNYKFVDNVVEPVVVASPAPKDVDGVGSIIRASMQ